MNDDEFDDELDAETQPAPVPAIEQERPANFRQPYSARGNASPVGETMDPAPAPSAVRRIYMPRELQEREHEHAAIARRVFAQDKESEVNAQKAVKSQREAEFRTKGQKFYTDAFGDLQPERDEAGRERYVQSGWKKGQVDTKDGRKKWALVRRNERGETETRKPKLVHSEDIKDPNLYHDFGGLRGEREVAGHVDDLAQSADPETSRAALAFRQKRNATIRRESLKPLQDAHGAAIAELEGAKLQKSQLDGSIAQLSQEAHALEKSPAFNATRGGFIGIGSEPTEEATRLRARHAELKTALADLTKQSGELGAATDPKEGPLTRKAKVAKLELDAWSHQSKIGELDDLANQRRASLRAQGKNPKGDHILDQITQKQALFGAHLSKIAQQRESDGDAMATGRAAGDSAPLDPLQLAAAQSVHQQQAQNLGARIQAFNASPGDSPEARKAEVAAIDGERRALLAERERLGAWSGKLTAERTKEAVSVVGDLQRDRDSFRSDFFVGNWSKLFTGDESRARDERTAKLRGEVGAAWKDDRTSALEATERTLNYIGAIVSTPLDMIRGRTLADIEAQQRHEQAKQLIGDFKGADALKALKLQGDYSDRLARREPIVRVRESTAGDALRNLTGTDSLTALQSLHSVLSADDGTSPMLGALVGGRKISESALQVASLINAIPGVNVDFKTLGIDEKDPDSFAKHAVLSRAVGDLIRQKYSGSALAGLVAGSLDQFIAMNAVAAPIAGRAVVAGKRTGMVAALGGVKTAAERASLWLASAGVGASQSFYDNPDMSFAGRWVDIIGNTLPLAVGEAAGNRLERAVTRNIPTTLGAGKLAAGTAARVAGGTAGEVVSDIVQGLVQGQPFDGQLEDALNGNLGAVLGMALIRGAGEAIPLRQARQYAGQITGMRAELGNRLADVRAVIDTAKDQTPEGERARAVLALLPAGAVDNFEKVVATLPTGSVERAKDVRQLRGQNAQRLGQMVVVGTFAEQLQHRIADTSSALSQIERLPDYAPIDQQSGQPMIAPAVTGANRDAARALVKIANGVRAEQLTEAERDGLGWIGRELGTEMVRDVDGRPVITDKARVWLLDQAPAASRVIRKTEAERVAQVIAEAAPTDAPVQSAPAITGLESTEPDEIQIDPALQRELETEFQPPASSGATVDARTLADLPVTPARASPPIPAENGFVPVVDDSSTTPAEALPIPAPEPLAEIQGSDTITPEPAFEKKPVMDRETPRGFPIPAPRSEKPNTGNQLPPRTADTMSDVIGVSSPSGKMSKRARGAANERIRVKLFGKEGLPAPQSPQLSEIETLRRQAKELRDTAARGLKPKAHSKRATELETRADALERAQNREPLAPPQSFKATQRELLQTIDAAIEAAPSEEDFREQAIKDSVKEPGLRRNNAKERQRADEWVTQRVRELASNSTTTPTVTIKSGNTKFTVRNTADTLARLRKAVEKRVGPATRPEDGDPISAAKVEAGFKSAKTDAERRGWMDMMTDAQLAKFGLDEKFVRVAPGQVLTREAAAALQKLKSGEDAGQFDIEASTSISADEFTGEGVDVADGTGTQPTRAEVVRTHIPLADKIAAQYRIPGLDADDIRQEARRLLVKAVTDFNPARGEFAPFAGTVIRNRLRDLFNREVHRVRTTGTSTDAPDADSAALIDLFADTSTGRDAAERAETRDIVRTALRSLPARLRKILSARADGATFEEIARTEGVSRQRIYELAENGIDLMDERLRDLGVRGFEDGILTSTGSTNSGEVDPASPAAFTFTTPPDDERARQDAAEVQRFEDGFNRGRPDGDRIRLEVRRIAAGNRLADPVRSEAGGSDAAGILRTHRALEAAFGKRIIFVESSGPVTWSAATAKQSANTILVNTKAPSAFMALVGHELAHNIANQAPDLYKALARVVAEVAPMPEGYEAEKLGHGYRREDIAGEWVNDAIGTRFDEPQFWREVARVADRRDVSDMDFRGLMEHVIDWLSKLGDRLRRLLHDGTGDAFIRDIDRLRSTAAEVLVEYQQRGPLPDNPAAARFTATPDSELSTVEGEKLNREWTAFAPESGTLGIPRAEMPQIKSEHRGALVQFLKGRGIEHAQEEVAPNTLKPTQAEYAPAKVEKARKFDGESRAILVSSDGHVVDGHHQWVADLTDSSSQPVRVIRLNAPVRELLPVIAQFPSVESGKGAPTSREIIEVPDPMDLESMRGTPVLLSHLTTAGDIDFGEFDAAEAWTNGEKTFEIYDSIRAAVKSGTPLGVAIRQANRPGSEAKNLLSTAEHYKKQGIAPETANLAAVEDVMEGIDNDRWVIARATDQMERLYAAKRKFEKVDIELSTPPAPPEPKPGAPVLTPPRKPAAVPGQPGNFFRSTPDSLRENGLKVARQIYTRRGHEETAAVAREIVDSLGEERAAEVSLSPADNGVPGDVKTLIYGQLLSRKARRLTEPKTSKAERAQAQREIQRLQATKPAQLTERGQEISALQRVYQDVRAATMSELLEGVRKEQDRRLGEPGKKAVDDAAGAIKDADEKAITAATKSLEKSLRAVRVSKSIWQEYRDAAADRLVALLDSRSTPTPPEAPLQAFTQRIVDEMRSRIKDSLPEKPSGDALPPTPAELLREAITNKEKYADVLTTVRRVFVEEYGEGSPPLELIDTELAALGLVPYSRRLIDRAIKDAHAAMRTSVTELARQHFTKTDPQAGDLADGIVALTGLQGADATKLAADLSERAKQLVADGRKKALDKLRKQMTATPKSRAVFDAIERATELNNMGAMHEADLREVVAKKLGLPTVSAEQMQQLATLADRVETATNHATRARAELDLATALRDVHGVGRADLATSIWYANILAGFATHARNIFGNFTNGTLQVATVIAANPRNAADALRGWVNGFADGWQDAKAIWTKGHGRRRDLDAKVGVANAALERADYAQIFPNLTGKLAVAGNKHAAALRYVFRAMRAVDAVFFHAAKESYTRIAVAKILEGEYSGLELREKIQETLSIAPHHFTEAERQAAGEGYTDLDKALRVADIIDERRKATKPGSVAAEAAERFALEATYNQEPEGWAGVIYYHLAKLTDAFRPAGAPVLKAFLPFLRVPTNVMNTSLNFTPVGALRAVRGVPVVDRAGEIGRREFTDEERMRLYIQSFGSSLAMAGIYAAAMAGADDDEPWFTITATGPTDFRKQAQLRATGWRPHSLRVGETWLGYKDTPLLIPLAIVGNMVDAHRYQKTKDDVALGSRAIDATMRGGRVLFDTSMLSGLGTLMDFVQDRASPDRVGRFLSRIPADLVVPFSNLLRQIDQTFNPESRKPAGPLGEVGAALPFVRNSGSQRVDVLGDPVRSRPTDSFVSFETNDALRELLRDKNVFVPTASRDTKIGDRVMTPEEFGEFERLRGSRLKRELEVRVGALRPMNREQVEKIVQRLAREATEDAKNNVRRQSLVGAAR